MTGAGDFARLAQALTRHAQGLASARAAERRAGDRKWRSARLLWPDLMRED